MFSSSLPKTIFRLLAVLILLGITAWSFWQYQQAQQKIEELSNPQDQAELAQQERQSLIDKVASLMVLPEENPVILNIENAAVMAQTQPFFRGAIDGDVVLIYPEAAKSIIYSPSRDIIVNVGTLTVENVAPSEESTPAAEE